MRLFFLLFLCAMTAYGQGYQPSGSSRDYTVGDLSVTGHLGVDGGVTVHGPISGDDFGNFADVITQTATTTDTGPYSLTSLGGLDVVGGGKLTCSSGQPSSKACFAVNGTLDIDSSAGFDAGVVVKGKLNVGSAQWSLSSTVGTCDASSSRTFTSFRTGAPYIDGGTEDLPAWCDGSEWRSLLAALPLTFVGVGSDIDTGDKIGEMNPGTSGGALWYCSASNQAPGQGAGTFKIQIKQGSTILCQSSNISCTVAAGSTIWDGDPRGGTGDGPCTANWFTPRAAAGSASDYNVYAVVVGTCSANNYPTFSGTCIVRLVNTPTP